MADKLVFQVKGSNQPFFEQNVNADFVLLESDWDDFGYRTSYNVVATEKLLNGRPECTIGSIKIIQNRQQGGVNILLGKFRNTNGVFEELPHDFVSITTSLRFFETLFCILSPEERQDFLDSMHLVLTEKGKYAQVVEESLLNSTAFRFSSRENTFEELQEPYRLMMSELNGKEIVNEYLNNIGLHRDYE
jgi:hypothetical protein